MAEIYSQEKHVLKRQMCATEICHQSESCVGRMSSQDVLNELMLLLVVVVWLSTQSNNSLVSDRQTVPFLPVNPEFSATRNQASDP